MPIILNNTRISDQPFNAPYVIIQGDPNDRSKCVLQPGHNGPYFLTTVGHVQVHFRHLTINSTATSNSIGLLLAGGFSQLRDIGIHGFNEALFVDNGAHVIADGLLVTDCGACITVGKLGAKLGYTDLNGVSASTLPFSRDWVLVGRSASSSTGIIVRTHSMLMTPAHSLLSISNVSTQVDCQTGGYCFTLGWPFGNVN